MLTTKQIEEVVKEGYKIIFQKRLHPQRYCGLCLPDKKEIRIYLPQLINGYDSLALTIIHEFIETRDKLKKSAISNRSDWGIELEATETYKRNPEIIDYILKLYSINLDSLKID